MHKTEQTIILSFIHQQQVLEIVIISLIEPTNTIQKYLAQTLALQQEI